MNDLNDDLVAEKQSSAKFAIKIKIGKSMFKTNEYFDGNVMSMAFENEEGKATVGIMAAGEYEFGTSTVEYMTVISGEMTVLLPGDADWKIYKPYDTFRVEKDTKFKLIIKADCAYKCIYK